LSGFVYYGVPARAKQL